MTEAFRSPVQRARLARLAGILIILGMAIGLPLTGWIGFDYKQIYWGSIRAGTWRTDPIMLSPYPTVWLFSLFAWVPLAVAAVLWYLANALGFIFALHRLKGQYLWAALSMPVMWTFIGGQIEGIIALGLALAVTASPWWASLGILLLSFKPQIGLFAIAYVLLHRRDWRLLVIPVVAYALSFVQWGWWIPEWLAKTSALGEVVIASQNGSQTHLFPLALILLPLLWFFRKDLQLWLLLGGLIMPYYSVYSLAPAHTVESKRTTPFLVVGMWLATALLIFLVEVMELRPMYLYSAVLLAAVALRAWELHRDRQAAGMEQHADLSTD